MSINNNYLFGQKDWINSNKSYSAKFKNNYLNKMFLSLCLIFIGSMGNFVHPTWANKQAGSAPHAHEAKAENSHHSGHNFAFGEPGDLKVKTRTIIVEVNDNMRYVPEQIEVNKGENIRFLVKNKGKIKHEMVLGSLAELKEHAELMNKFPEMEHADPNQVSVDPGKEGELLWKFTKSMNIHFGCLHPGHFDAGMKGNIVVK